jgi:hypothetical protein
MKTATQKDIESRQDTIENELRGLFESNLKITDWNVPEADDQYAAEMLVSIIQGELNRIKKDVSDGKYEYY